MPLKHTPPRRSPRLQPSNCGADSCSIPAGTIEDLKMDPTTIYEPSMQTTSTNHAAGTTVVHPSATACTATAAIATTTVYAATTATSSASIYTDCSIAAQNLVSTPIVASDTARKVINAEASNVAPVSSHIAAAIEMPPSSVSLSTVSATTNALTPPYLISAIEVTRSEPLLTLADASADKINTIRGQIANLQRQLSEALRQTSAGSIPAISETDDNMPPSSISQDQSRSHPYIMPPQHAADASQQINAAMPLLGSLQQLPTTLSSFLSTTSMPSIVRPGCAHPLGVGAVQSWSQPTSQPLHQSVMMSQPHMMPTMQQLPEAALRLQQPPTAAPLLMSQSTSQPFMQYTAQQRPLSTSQLQIAADYQPPPHSVPTSRPHVMPSMQILPQMPSVSQQFPQSTPHSLQYQMIAQMPKRIQDLPEFCGCVEEWPMFLSAYQHSTAAYQYNNFENCLRLQKALRGEAKESVRSLLIHPDNVGSVMEQLQFQYGRPELIIYTQLQQIREISAISEGAVEKLVPFAVKVQNFAAFFKTANAYQHLMNPTLMNELVQKLPMSKRLEWAQFGATLGRLPNVSDFANWMTTVANLIRSVQNPLRFQNEPKKKTVLHASDNVPAQLKCPVCNSERKIVECKKFVAMKVPSRWQEAKSMQLYFLACC